MTANINPQLDDSWKELLKNEFQKDYFTVLKQKLLEEKSKGAVHYPPGPLIFNALDQCPVDKVKVVILGQDPYHNPGEAHGLCFSVPLGIKTPPSLVNIYKELKEEFGYDIPSHGNLEHWAKQGVLLLNASLTVRANTPASHSNYGWHIFTDSIIQRLTAQREDLVFLLWGSHARKKKNLVAMNRGHVILEAPHPSPLSAHRGFFGCGHFKKCNEILEQKGQAPIDWEIPDQ